MKFDSRLWTQNGKSPCNCNRAILSLAIVQLIFQRCPSYYFKDAFIQAARLKSIRDNGGEREISFALSLNLETRLITPSHVKSHSDAATNNQPGNKMGRPWPMGWNRQGPKYLKKQVLHNPASE